MRVVRANGVHLAVSVTGPDASPTLVLANSLGTDYRVFDALLPFLPAGLRIIRYDKRGHGLSESPPSPYAIGDHVADLAGLFDVLGVRSAIVLGLSIGGIIAQGLAAAAPDLVRGLVLMDTASKIGSGAMWNARIAAVRENGIAGIADAIMERWFSPAFLASRPDGVAAYRRMLMATSVEGYIGSCIALRDADYRAEAPAIRVPTLVICGTADRALPPDSVRATAAAIPGAEYFEVAGVGHFPCVEAPEATGRRICDFLRVSRFVS